ncbi:MAG: hypothetical protein ABSF80_07330 [Chitinispirillaceae bacterium]|jgi:hypothetical protein
MESDRHRLYDEHLVRNIMLSTGLSVVEYLRENTKADSEEIGDFIEANAEEIIDDTIKHLKSMEDFDEKGSSQDSEQESGDWPLNEEG